MSDYNMGETARVAKDAALTVKMTDFTTAHHQSKDPLASRYNAQRLSNEERSKNSISNN